jgi:large subunit ribosomal protein L17
MRHRSGFNRLGRKASHRIALHRNMVTSLFKYERIRTTKAKALEIRRTAEKMITRAKLDSVHNRRIVGKDIKDQGILAKLFTDIGPRFKERPGGYTRVLKIGYRDGDAAQMVVLELVERDEAAEAEQSANRRERRRARAERRAAEDAAAEEAIAADEAAAADQAAVSESKDDSGGSTEDKQSGE